jgi:hypothetical protein
MFEEMRETAEERMAELPDSVRQAMHERMARRGGGAGGHPGGAGGSGGGPPGGMGGMGGMSFGGGSSSDDTSAMLWYLDGKGRLSATRIVKGVTDGRMTEIVRGRDIEEGLKVIVSFTEPDEDDGPSNPLATSPFGRRRG